jgi:hypothetical protein
MRLLRRTGIVIVAAALGGAIGYLFHCVGGT